MEIKGKKVIVIGERDGVQADAIAACVQPLGAEVVHSINECFV